MFYKTCKSNIINDITTALTIYCSYLFSIGKINAINNVYKTFLDNIYQ